MTPPAVAEALCRFHQVANACVQTAVSEVFRQYGPEFVLSPRHHRRLLVETGADAFFVVVTRVAGVDGGVSLLGYPEFCEDELHEWRLRDIYAVEDRLALAESLFDLQSWTLAVQPQ